MSKQKDTPIKLPLQPFQNYLLKRSTEFENLALLSSVLEISEKRLSSYINGYRIEKGKKKYINQISIDVPDKCAVKLGDHLRDIFPDLYDF